MRYINLYKRLINNQVEYLFYISDAGTYRFSKDKTDKILYKQSILDHMSKSKIEDYANVNNFDNLIRIKVSEYHSVKKYPNNNLIDIKDFVLKDLDDWAKYLFNLLEGQVDIISTRVYGSLFLLMSIINAMG